MRDRAAVLTVTNLRKSYGSLVAVDDASFDVPVGGVLGIMGVNGAGKTTLLNCLSGLSRPSSGRIQFRSRDITSSSPHAISRLGMGRTFQIPRSFRGLTVLENVLVVPVSETPKGALLDRAIEVLEAVRLIDLCDHYADELSGGQQKLLELARIMMNDPKLILMDEPFAGMHPDLCRLFIQRVEALAASGVGIILVSHDPDTLYRLSQSIMVMNQGQIIARGTPEDIRRTPAVIEAYLGTDQW